MPETLGERMERRLAIAVERGLITEAEKVEWCKRPPLSREQYDHRSFILRLIREGESDG